MRVLIFQLDGKLPNIARREVPKGKTVKILLFQLDGRFPNIAIMRIAAHHAGDDVVFQHTGNSNAIARGLFDRYDRVYASLIFERTKPLARYLKTVYPDAIIGGTGWDIKLKLEDIGITIKQQDYSLYPAFKNSIGFSQRGCRLRCSFCCVPEKEGAVYEENTITGIWRGDPFPRHIILLDNDFFGQKNWQKRIQEMIDGRFRVSFNQGINARMLTDETAAAIASVKYSDDQFKTKRIYTAWDNTKDEHRLFSGLNALVKHGVKPHQIMVYILVGYWKNETAADREYRRAKLREFGARPYPMPFIRTPELVGFQRWVIGAYDKRIGWQAWEAASYRPEKLGLLPSKRTESF